MKLVSMPFGRPQSSSQMPLETLSSHRAPSLRSAPGFSHLTETSRVVVVVVVVRYHVT